MNGIDFWKKDAGKISAIIESIDSVLSDSFIWVINLKEHQAWCSAETKEYFGLSDQIFPCFMETTKQLVHPHDRENYMKEISERFQGINLDSELCMRMRGKDGNYVLFSFRMQVIRDEKDAPEYLVAALNNENTFPEFDARTDLFSYVRYVRDLENEMSYRGKLAILQIQLEGFHTFHLIYGLDYSEEFLRIIAEHFIHMMDEDKVVYRIEGERFAFILKKAGREELISFEQQVRKMLKEGIEFAENRISLKMDAGAILFENYQGDSSTVRGQIDYALDHSIHKHQGKLVIFNDEVCTSRGADLALMKVIHQSVRNHCEGFYLEYQPIVDAEKGHVVGAEALVRWSREPYGKVPPSMFIEWMETDPSMYDLGNFVLRTALAETKHLLAIKPDFFVNVNLSVRQLERTEFRTELLNILADTSFPADHLCLELTERCRDFPLDKLKQEVAFFQSFGIRVAMDDYGTGSASSSIVMNIPMDEIKIDMSFIRNIMDNSKNQAMVRSILYFAGKSDMATCLEGVENEELRDYLQDYNATWLQGYYYAKPLPVSLLEEMVSGQNEK